MKTTSQLINRPRLVTLLSIALTLATAVLANGQELITNGNFSNGLTNWTTSNFGVTNPVGQFGINANGPTDTSAASGNYAYAGGSTYNLLMQDVTVTTGNAYRLTFLAGSKSGQGNATGFLSLREVGNPNNYNSASFDYNPSDAVFGSYTVDFVAGMSTIGVWLRSDNTYAAYDSVSVTPIASVANALNYSSASGYSVISSALTGSGKVTVGAGTGGLTLSGANTHTGGTEVTGGTLFVTGAGTLGATNGTVTVSGGGVLDLRNQQTRTGTITMNNQDARILSGDSTGSIVNNGGAFQFGGGLLNVPLSGSGGMNVTGGGGISSSNSYTGDTTISGTTGWYGTDQLFVQNTNALGAASGDLTISGGYVNLTVKTITRSGNLTISGGSLENGTVSKSGSDYNIQGGSIGAVLAGTAGLIKSGSATAALSGANTYSGGTTINGGTLSVYSAGGLGNAAGAVTVNTGATLYTDSGLTISRTGDVTVNGGSLLTDNNNFGTISVSGGNFIANNAATLAVKLAGTAGLTVGGTGETYLWTDSSYTGATVISSGQLTLGGLGAISSQSSLQIDSGAAVNLTGLYASNNINRTFAGLTGAGVLDGAGGTVTINKASGSDTFSGGIQGGQGLIKAGAGTLALGGASSYTGSTAVNAGTLLIANGAALGATSGGSAVASGAQLRLNATNSGFTVGNESLTISGQGVTTGGALRNAAGDNTWQGKVTLGADATIGAASGTSLTMDVASGNAIEAAGFNLTFDGAGTNRVLDSIDLGAGGLTKIGSGTTILAAGNNFTGATAVNAGVLNLNSSAGSSLGSTASVSVTNATLLVSQSNQVNDSAAVTLSGGTIQRGAGVSEKFGNLTLSTAGTLNYGSGGAGVLEFGSWTPGSTVLTLSNFGAFNQLKFSSDLSAFISTTAGSSFSNANFSISGMTAGGFTASFSGGTFTITSVPEPSTVLAALGLAGLMAWPVRRRLVRDARSILGLRAPMRDRLAARHH
jgi:fibronectin-binding autotransporter adhesin